MAGKSQHHTLNSEEDEQLRGFEQSEHLRPKVRLRAQVVRLNAAGWSRRRIAFHTGRTYGTVCQYLKRWHERGVEGLADAPATNQPEKLTREMRELVSEKLKEKRTLHFELVEESVKSERVLAFIDQLTREATPDQLTVIVLDNASFHTSANIKERRQGWEEKNVLLRYLPPYAPHLNPIEALWKHLKSFLLPRRCYDSVAQLKQALLEALNLLGAIRVNSSVGEA